MLGPLVSQCLTTPHESRHQMVGLLRALFKNQPNMKIPLKTFLEKYASVLLTKNMADFLSAVAATLRFVFVRKPSGGGDVTVVPSSDTVFVMLHSKEELEKRVRRSEEKADAETRKSGAYKRVFSVVQALLEHIRESSDEESKTEWARGGSGDGKEGGLPDSVSSDPRYLFSLSHALEALGNSVLVIHRLPLILSQAKMPLTPLPSPSSVPAWVTPGPSLLLTDFLIQHVLSLDCSASSVVEKPSAGPLQPLQRSTEVAAACRLLLLLSTFRGTVRRSVLNSLLLAFRQHSQPEDGDRNYDGGSQFFVGKSGAATTAAATDFRLRLLTRLACLTTFVVKASGLGGADPLHPAIIAIPSPQQQVSVDVINHFISANLPALLTAALSSVPLGHPLAGQAVNAILEPLEMMTRPKLLANLDKLNSQSQMKQGGPIIDDSNSQGPRDPEEGSFSASSVLLENSDTVVINAVPPPVTFHSAYSHTLTASSNSEIDIDANTDRRAESGRGRERGSVVSDLAIAAPQHVPDNEEISLMVSVSASLPTQDGHLAPQSDRGSSNSNSTLSSPSGGNNAPTCRRDDNNYSNDDDEDTDDTQNSYLADLASGTNTLGVSIC